MVTIFGLYSQWYLAYLGHDEFLVLLFHVVPDSHGYYFSSPLRIFLESVVDLQLLFQLLYSSLDLSVLPLYS